jgi:hypothetical protein
VGLGVTLVFGSVAFRVWGAPALVRFPLNVDTTTHYTGTSVTYVDQATLLPLAKPRSEPASISRHVKVVSGTHDRAVIDETVTVKAGSTTNLETYQYVIDRRSMKMVADPRQFAFGEPTAIMHAAGSFRVNFAMGTAANGNYLSYIPEADAVSHLTLAEGPHYHSDARATVIDFASNLEKPVAPYYLAHLKAMGLPMQVDPALLLPRLASNGIDVTRALADVGPRLTPAESKLVSDTLAKKVPLQYYFISTGLISIEPTTGALVDVHTQQHGVAVKPDLSGASVLQPLLDKYAAIPSVRALSTGLAALAAKAPQVAQSFEYTQTVASSLAAARDARSHARTMNLVNVRIPWALGLAGGVLLLVTFGLGLRRRRAARPIDVTSEKIPDAEREPVGASSGPRPS